MASYEYVDFCDTRHNEGCGFPRFLTNDETADFGEQCIVTSETEKAIRIRVKKRHLDWPIESNSSEVEAWIPKSVIIKRHNAENAPHMRCPYRVGMESIGVAGWWYKKLQEQYAVYGKQKINSIEVREVL